MLAVIARRGTPSTPGYSTPVIAKTSGSGVNPPAFSVTAANIQIGWYYQLDYTTNGTAPDGTPDGSAIALTSDMALGGTLDWGTGPFSSGATIKWALRYGPSSSGPWSNWSNVLTETVA